MSASGSIDGAISTWSMASSRANCGAEKTAASYCSTHGRRNSQAPGAGADRSMWQRHSQCEPGPAALDELDGLRVVDEDQVVAQVERAQVLLRGGGEDLPVARRERDRLAVERVVDPLGDGEELLAAAHDVPARVDADLAQQRHQAVQDLGDAAADGGRVDVLHAPAAQPLTQEAELVDGARADELGVGLQGELAVAHAPVSAATRGAIRREQPLTEPFGGDGVGIEPADRLGQIALAELLVQPAREVVVVALHAQTCLEEVEGDGTDAHDPERVRELAQGRRPVSCGRA